MYLAVLHHSQPQWLYDLYGHIQNRRWGNPAGTQHSLVLFMTTLTGVMSCGTAGPLGSVPGTWTH